MARKTDAGTLTNNAKPAPSASALRHLRTQIDKLDQQILKLVNERATLAGEIGRVKNDQGEEVFSPAREEENDPIYLLAKSSTTDTARSATIWDTAPSITFFQGHSTAKSRKAISAIAVSIRLNTFVRVWSCSISSSLILKPSISKLSRTRLSSSAKT